MNPWTCLQGYCSSSKPGGCPGPFCWFGSPMVVHGQSKVLQLNDPVMYVIVERFSVTLMYNQPGAAGR